MSWGRSRERRALLLGCRGSASTSTFQSRLVRGLDDVLGELGEVGELELGDREREEAGAARRRLRAVVGPEADSSIASSTRRRFCRVTRAEPLTTLLTVFIETPARTATCSSWRARSLLGVGPARLSRRRIRHGRPTDLTPRRIDNNQGQIGRDRPYLGQARDRPPPFFFGA